MGAPPVFGCARLTLCVTALEVPRLAENVHACLHVLLLPLSLQAEEILSSCTWASVGKYILNATLSIECDCGIFTEIGSHDILNNCQMLGV